MGNSNKIYLILSHSGTITSKFIKLYTKTKYTHISLALEEDMKEMYSFARRYRYVPLPGGFVTESIDQRKCIIYEMKVSSKQYRKLKKVIRRYKINNHKYSYNIVGLIGVIINKPIERQRSCFCSQFVNRALNESGIKIINKPPGLTRPMDFTLSDKLRVVYEGDLEEYRRGVEL